LCRASCHDQDQFTFDRRIHGVGRSGVSRDSERRLVWRYLPSLRRFSDQNGQRPWGAYIGTDVDGDDRRDRHSRYWHIDHHGDRAIGAGRRAGVDYWDWDFKRDRDFKRDNNDWYRGRFRFWHCRIE
jgi:hypothetical protein